MTIHYFIVCVNVSIQTLEMMRVTRLCSRYEVNLVIILIVIVAMIDQCTSPILVYNTENTLLAGEVLCMFYQRIVYPGTSTVKYCIRFKPAITYINRNSTICLHGDIWHFSALLEKEISPWEILSWSSTVEKAEDYARIFYNRSEPFGENSFLCNCTEGYFGKSCEYQLLLHSSLFSKALEKLFESRIHPEYQQIWGTILCYETLECNYGQLCLDWRNICDGATELYEWN